MPELPEVETIKRELDQLIRNKKIKSVEINLAKQVKFTRAKFLRLVEGMKIKRVRRRAKVLIFDLSNNYHLLFHLKMTGQLIYRARGGKLSGGGHPIKHELGDLPNKYSHVIFNFSDGARLFFNDTRQFGWVKLVDDKEWVKFESEFGPEPLEISFKEFRELFGVRRTAIKPLLMDSKFIAGIGNIYAAEALWCAGILPTRGADKISDKELKKVYNCLVRILKLAVAKKGTSAENYVDALGRSGSMMPYLKVYGRAGMKCVKCKSELKSMKQGQRVTVYCTKCQK